MDLLRSHAPPTVTGRVAQTTYKALSKLDAGWNFTIDGKHPFRNKGLQVPRLRDVLTRFPTLLTTLDLKDQRVNGEGELGRQLTWAETDASLDHWRTGNGQEVDFVVESLSGAVVGIEAKAAADVHEDDFKGLRVLRDQLGDDFIAGVVVHCGDRVRRFGDRLYSVAGSAIWT